MRISNQKSLFMFLVLLTITGVCTAFYSEHLITSRNEAVINDSLETELKSVVEAVSEAVRTYEYGLRGLKAAVDTVGFENFNYQAQLSYFKSRDYSTEFPGARGFGVIKKVAEADLEKFLDAARNDRNGDFNLKQLDSPKDPLFIIQYIEPENVNSQAVGLDVGSEFFRRQAALISATSRTTQLTGPITLVQASQKAKHGFLLLHPIFKMNAKSLEEELAGWVYAPLLIHEILDSVTKGQEAFNVAISDVTAPVPISFYGNWDESELSAKVFVTDEVDVFGRRWLVKGIPTPTYLAELPLENATFVFWQIVVVTMLIVVLLFVVVHYFSQRLSHLKSRLSFASVVENASDGVIGLNSQFAVTSWNKSAKSIFDFVEPESVNKPFLNWLGRAISSEKLISMYKQVAKGQVLNNINIKYQPLETKGERYLSINMSPLFINKEFSGATITVHDSTDIVNLQHELMNKNKELLKDISSTSQKLLSQISFEDSILNNTTLAIIKCRVDGEITLFNQMACRLFGFSVSEVVGKRNITQFFDATALKIAPQADKLPEDFLHQMKSQSMAGEHISVKCLLKNKSDELFPTLLNVAPICSEDKIESYVFIVNDISQNQLLARNLELVESAVDNAQDVLLWLTPDGNIFHCNPYAKIILGLYISAEQKRNISEVMNINHSDTWDNIRKSVLSSGRKTFEASFYKNGRYISYNLVSACLLTIENEQVIYLAAKDISEMQEKEKLLSIALEKADAASTAKTDFIANMSHELRTPLNAVSGSLQLLELTESEQKQQNYLAAAKEAVGSLTSIVNDILEFTSLDGEQIAIKNSDVELDEILSQVGVQLYALVKNKPVEVHYSVDKDVPHFFNTDAIKIKRILKNLGGNAVKFTDKGEVVIRIFVMETLDNGKIRLGISVKDTGVGIASDKLTSIFELFSQADNTASRQHGGLGLGLTIASRYAQLLGGDIKVQSEVGSGSEFICDILVGPASSLKTVRTPDPHKQVNVLLVDDNKTSLQILTDTLAQLNWNITSTTKPDEALQLYMSACDHGEPFDIALLDWKMPVTDGWELAAEIRKITPVDKMPLLIMVTAHNRDELSDKFNEQVNVLNGFLTKPVTRSQIFNAYFDALSVPDLSKHGSTFEEKALAGVRILLVEDNPTNQLIAKELIEARGAILTIASGGEQAIRELENSLLNFHVILMDIQMPGLDGYETCRRIKTKDKFKLLPIIAMTANVLPSDKQKCFDAGMIAHIGKPFDLQEVIFTIERVLKGTPQTEYVRELKDHRLAMSEEVIAYCKSCSISIDAAMQRFSNVVPTYIRSLDLFILDLQQYTDELVGGITEHDELKRLFHTLKSTAGALGFSPLSEVSAELEQSIASNNSASLSPEQMNLALRNLSVALEQSIRLRALMGSQDEQGVGSSVTEDKADFLQTFELLCSEVTNFNMHALDTLLEILPELNNVSPAIADKLVASLNKLKFKEAKVILAELNDMLGDQNGN